MGRYKLICNHCHQEQSGYAPFCHRCQGLTDVVYPLETIKLTTDANPYRRFFELLPLREPQHIPENMHYTPMVKAEALGRHLGLKELYLKNETEQSTNSTKFRMALVALAYLYENGVRHFCTSSTGNSSTAYAAVISRFPEMKMSLFTAEDFRGRVNYQPSPQIQHFILRKGTFVDAFNASAAYAAAHGYTAERGFFNPGRREGLKLAFFEAVDQIQAPIDWYVQAVSSAMGVYGTYTGARELQELGLISQGPRLLCVQQASCAPQATAWQANAENIRPEDIVPQPQGLASAILRGDPSRTYPYIRRIVKASQGEILAVTEADQTLARRLVLELEGISICYASATAVAGVMRAHAQGIIDAKQRVLINLTGSDRPEQLSTIGEIWLENTANGWQKSGHQGP
jgi:threonine synthase